MACDHYVDTGGDDGTGDGTIGNPWLTVGYALSQSSSGEEICINDGTYDEGQLTVPLGVSFTSTSQDNTRVKVQPSTPLGYGVPFVVLSSVAPGTNGNQTISYLEFDGINGANTCRWGFEVKNRSNVHVHHCNIHDFSDGSKSHALWVGSTQVAHSATWSLYWPKDPQAPGTDTNINAVWPTNPVEGFEFNNNTVTNCAYRESLSSGGFWFAVQLSQLKDSSIHHNTVDCTASYGECIGGCNAILHNVDIYNNNVSMGKYTDRSSYSIEVWLLRNGCEIHNNTSNTCFSIVYGKETLIYDNSIVVTPADSCRGIGIECIGQTYCKTYDNYVQGTDSYGIDLGLSFRHGGYRVINTEIYNNVVYNTDSGGICVMSQGSSSVVETTTVDGCKMYNNTVDGGTRAYGQIRLEQNNDVGTGVLSNVEVKNNILTNGTGHAGKTVGSVGSTIDYNLFYGNTPNDWLSDTDTNTVIDNPDFVATGNKPTPYYTLQGVSPAIDAGIDVGLPYEGTDPDIGAYEYPGDSPAAKLYGLLGSGFKKLIG